MINSLGETDDFIKEIFLVKPMILQKLRTSLSKTNDFIKMIHSLSKTDDFIKSEEIKTFPLCVA